MMRKQLNDFTLLNFEIYTYCVIKNKSNGCAIDVCDGDGETGAKVIVWSPHGGDNQRWYSDPRTGTIRSKMNDFCLDFKERRIVLNPFQPGDKDQQWEFHKNTIRNIFDHEKVLELRGCEHEGTELGCDKFSDKGDQFWEFEPADGSADHARPRLFYIVSELNGKVVDIEDGSDKEGSKVVVWEKGQEMQSNQLWYCDYNGYIRSSLNNTVFYSRQSGSKLKMFEYRDSTRNHWIINGNKIINGDGDCLDIRGGGKEGDGAVLCAYRNHGKPNQLWTIEYAS